MNETLSLCMSELTRELALECSERGLLAAKLFREVNRYYSGEIERLENLNMNIKDEATNAFLETHRIYEDIFLKEE